MESKSRINLSVTEQSLLPETEREKALLDSRTGARGTISKIQ